MLVKGVQKTPKTLLAIAVALGCLPEVKVPITKTLCGSDPRTKASELDLTESLLPEDSSRSTERYYASFHRKEATNRATQL